MWVASTDLARSAGHPFYERLNRVLDEAGFDAFVEAQSARFYADGVGRGPRLRTPRVPPAGSSSGPRTPCRRLLSESTASGWGEGRASAPGGDWRPQRFGPVPSQYSVSARLDLERSILAACGVPVSLVIPPAGADAREGWRRFLHGTLGPIAALVGAELERVGPSGRLDFRALMASDLQGRARTFRQLRDGGMGESGAGAVCGFD